MIYLTMHAASKATHNHVMLRLAIKDSVIENLRLHLFILVHTNFVTKQRLHLHSIIYMFMYNS